MEMHNADLPCPEERQSPSSSLNPQYKMTPKSEPFISTPVNSSLILKPKPVTNQVSPIQPKSQMQFQEYASQVPIPKTLQREASNTSLERVITTSRMAALQSHRGSTASLQDLRTSLLAASNPRRGSPTG